MNTEDNNKKYFSYVFKNNCFNFLKQSKCQQLIDSVIDRWINIVNTEKENSDISSIFKDNNKYIEIIKSFWNKKTLGFYERNLFLSFINDVSIFNLLVSKTMDLFFESTFNLSNPFLNVYMMIYFGSNNLFFEKDIENNSDHYNRFFYYIVCYFDYYLEETRKNSITTEYNTFLKEKSKNFNELKKELESNLEFLDSNNVFKNSLNSDPILFHIHSSLYNTIKSYNDKIDKLEGIKSFLYNLILTSLKFKMNNQTIKVHYINLINHFIDGYNNKNFFLEMLFSEELEINWKFYSFINMSDTNKIFNDLYDYKYHQLFDLSYSNQNILKYFYDLHELCNEIKIIEHMKVNETNLDILKDLTLLRLFIMHILFLPVDDKDNLIMDKTSNNDNIVEKLYKIWNDQTKSKKTIFGYDIKDIFSSKIKSHDINEYIKKLNPIPVTTIDSNSDNNNTNNTNNNNQKILNTLNIKQINFLDTTKVNSFSFLKKSKCQQLIDSVINKRWICSSDNEISYKVGDIFQSHEEHIKLISNFWNGKDFTFYERNLFLSFINDVSIFNLLVSKTMDLFFQNNLNWYNTFENIYMMIYFGSNNLFFERNKNNQKNSQGDNYKNSQGDNYSRFFYFIIYYFDCYLEETRKNFITTKYNTLLKEKSTNFNELTVELESNLKLLDSNNVFENLLKSRSPLLKIHNLLIHKIIGYNYKINDELEGIKSFLYKLILLSLRHKINETKKEHYIELINYFIDGYNKKEFFLEMLFSEEFEINWKFYSFINMSDINKIFHNLYIYKHRQLYILKNSNKKILEYFNKLHELCNEIKIIEHMKKNQNNLDILKDLTLLRLFIMHILFLPVDDENNLIMNKTSNNDNFIQKLYKIWNDQTQSKKTIFGYDIKDIFSLTINSDYINEYIKELNPIPVTTINNNNDNNQDIKELNKNLDKSYINNNITNNKKDIVDTTKKKESNENTDKSYINNNTTNNKTIKSDNNNQNINELNKNSDKSCISNIIEKNEFDGNLNITTTDNNNDKTIESEISNTKDETSNTKDEISNTKDETSNTKDEISNTKETVFFTNKIKFTIGLIITIIIGVGVFFGFKKHSNNDKDNNNDNDNSKLNKDNNNDNDNSKLNKDNMITIENNF